MTYGTAPVISGVAVRRPTAAPENPETVRSSVTLAGGARRSYDLGTRPVFELTWSKMTEAELAQLRTLVRPAFVPYTHLDGVTYVVETSAPKADPIGGTDPVRFAVSLTLTAQAPR